MQTIRIQVWVAFLTMAATGWAQTTECTSSIKIQSNALCRTPSISADGRFVAFQGDATNLVAGDTNGMGDVFVCDRQGGSIERVSVDSGGTQANGVSGLLGVAISADGRFVAFQSDADNLVAGDTNALTDVFVHDRQSGATERVSVATGGAQGDGNSMRCAISADGRFVAFRSEAANLVGGDTNGVADIFVHDRLTGATERVSVTSSGAQVNGGTVYYGPLALSADGRFVAFESEAPDLVGGDTNSTPDVFVHDRQTGTTELVSVATDGTQGNDSSWGSSISQDGRFVAFHSYATNLVAGDTNGHYDVFVHDRQVGTTERVSVLSDGTEYTDDSAFPSISPDGRFVVSEFYSYPNVYVGVRDRQNGTTIFVLSGHGGHVGSGYEPSLISNSAISADGRYVTFSSDVSSLVIGDTNGVRDIFVSDPAGVITQRVNRYSQTGNSFSEESAISADGNVVAFKSNATDFITGDTNGFYDVYAYDRRSGTMARVSVSTGGAEGNGPSQLPSVSSDGRYVAFSSEAGNLVAGDTNNASDIFLRDRQSGTTERVSVGSGGVEGNSNSVNPAISADGRCVAFASYASNLVTGDTNGTLDIFVRDRQTGTTERASVATGGIQAGSPSLHPSISADGRYVAFISYASNLVAGDTNGAADIFVHDRQSGATERVSVDSSGAQANADCDVNGAPSISADGRYVAFASDASNLVAGDTNGTGDVFVHDRQTGTTVRVSLTAGGAQANGGSYGNTSISSTGRFVAFPSYATNLVAGDTNGYSDVYLRDRQSGTTERLSISTGGVEGNRDSYAPAISADGRCVAFTSEAWTLVDNDVNFGYRDVFVRDRGPVSPFVSFCAGDGTIAACPCSNSGATGHGCENSSTTGGAILTATGSASLSADTVHLTASGEKPVAFSVVLQGSLAVSPLHYGDGLRCVGGTLKRLLSHNAVGGIVTIPQGADPSLSSKSASLGDLIAAGSTRNYQVYYRDPSTTFCPTPTGSAFNISNAIAVAWGE